MSVAAVVLAAGGSTRFGEPKQLAVFRGKPFVRHIVTATIEAGCAPVIVVVGEDAAQITSELTGLAVSIVVHPQWSNGLGSSIGVGLQHVIDSAAELEAAILLACDQPFVTAATLRQLIQLRQTSGKPIVASAYAATLGIPALFDRSCFPDLLQLKGDSGAKRVIFSRQHGVAAFSFPAAAVDIDTPADYERFLSQKEASFSAKELGETIRSCEQGLELNVHRALITAAKQWSVGGRAQSECPNDIANARRSFIRGLPRRVCPVS